MLGESLWGGRLGLSVSLEKPNADVQRVRGPAGSQTRVSLPCIPPTGTTPQPSRIWAWPCWCGGLKFWEEATTAGLLYQGWRGPWVTLCVSYGFTSPIPASDRTSETWVPGPWKGQRKGYEWINLNSSPLLGKKKSQNAFSTQEGSVLCSIYRRA